jgi:tetratricopeptide (TPR) repeat protein
MFEDEVGGNKTVDETTLVECFQDAQVQLLVLSACLSAKQHPHYLHNGLSAALYHAGIPHVIGMRESVFDTAAVKFAKALLHSLGKRGTVDVALQQARAAIIEPFKAAGGYSDMGSNPIRAAESYGQWCLPQLLSHERQQGLVDWEFTPQPPERAELKILLGRVSVPEHFRGRRRELRQWQNRLRDKTTNSLLITGLAGMGKTALAYKLLQGLHKDGYRMFTFSLRPEHDWQAVLLEMELALAENEDAYKEYELIRGNGLAVRANALLSLLLAQYGGKLALFFDNIESVQDEQFPHAVTDTTLQHWLQAAHQLTAQGLKLILTSRWRLPDWTDTEHYPLGKPVYTDYVAMVRLKGLSLTGERLQTAYETLGGNFRALEFFAQATQEMSEQETDEFDRALKRAAADSQTDMALARIVAQRSTEEIALLHRLLAYQTAVPLAGIEIIWDVDVTVAAEPILKRLLAVSLVEQYANPHTKQTEYLLTPLVSSWLLANNAPKPALPLLQTAARFLLRQLEERQNTAWEHILATHSSLLAANLTEQGHTLVLKWIVKPLNNAGMYRTLLNDWLSPLLESDYLQTRGEALNQIGLQYIHISQYDTAFDFLKNSLAISQEIGDKLGEGATLSNISQTYSARGDYDTAIDFFKQSLAIQQEIGHKEGEGAVLNNISQIYQDRGDYDTALDFLKKSLAIRQEIGDKLGEGTTLNNISLTYSARGDHETALDFLKKSLAIRQEIGDKLGEGTTLGNISNIYRAHGDHDTALDFIKQSLAIQQEIGDKLGEGTTLCNISHIYSTRGDYNTALDFLKQSLAIQQEIGDKSGESTTLNNISQIYNARGDYSTAIDLFKQSLTIQQEIGHKEGEGATLNNMATIALTHGDYDTAFDLLKKSLAIRQKIGDKKGEAITLSNISQVFQARSDYNTALDFLKKSLIIQQEIGDTAGLCCTLFNMGHVHRQNKELTEALQVWTKDYQLAKKMNLTQELQALEYLAANLGLPGKGLQGWEMLA